MRWRTRAWPTGSAFAGRARTREGKLQVELAQLSHLSTRLVRGWTHLERQKGGIGLRGPGETQLETDRRLIAKRIRTLRTRLEKLARQRDTGRHVRRESGREPGLSADGRGLLAVLAHAAHQDVVDGSGIEVVAGDQRGQHLSQQLDRMDCGERARGLAAAHGSADRVNDHGLNHFHAIIIMVY